jgi:hypothetical protein
LSFAGVGGGPSQYDGIRGDLDQPVGENQIVPSDALLFLS